MGQCTKKGRGAIGEGSLKKHALQSVPRNDHTRLPEVHMPIRMEKS